MYESFRWMDEEEDLDLRLVLDDYHANLDGVVIPTPNSTRRPSFRRQMSISKMPFGRNSFQSLQPRSPKTETPNHTRQKSRALSLMTPRGHHVVHDSVSSIDPNATHYQDPEARLKLRVYLASPQKFDEAIEFGFPSLDQDKENKENKPPTTTSTFLLNDIDSVSLFEDDVSMLDPDSPITPLEYRRPSPTDPSKHTPIPVAAPKKDENYTQALAGSREMTLRMTLTRPDLRADEGALYGWQTATKSPPLAEEEAAGEMRGPFGGEDGWGPEKDGGVVKRFWNRVRRI